MTTIKTTKYFNLWLVLLLSVLVNIILSQLIFIFRFYLISLLLFNRILKVFNNYTQFFNFNYSLQINMKHSESVGNMIYKKLNQNLKIIIE